MVRLYGSYLDTVMKMWLIDSMENQIYEEEGAEGVNYFLPDRRKEKMNDSFLSSRYPKDTRTPNVRGYVEM